MRLLALAALALAAAQPAAAQRSFDLKARYSKQEVMIPARDGVRLFTSIYIPRDSSTRHPILLRRTPYSCAPYGADRYTTSSAIQMNRYFRAGYIIVCQDVRGRYMSEGDYVNVRPVITVKRGPKDIDETTDTYDAVDWLVKHLPTSNGNVGISGISYPGFYTWMGTVGAHPAVKATSPQAPVSQWMGGDDWFHHGALLLAHAFDFYSSFGWPRSGPSTTSGRRFDEGTPDEYAFFLRMGPLANANARYFKHGIPFWDTLMTHGQWDAFWAARSILPHLKDLKPATLVVGGWFDTENLYGAVMSYEANERQSPGATNLLVMGPWFHGQWSANDGDSLGAIAWGSRTSRFYTDSIEGPFFDFYLEGKGKPNLPEAYVFNTGVKRWRRLDAWPPRNTQTRSLYLEEGGWLGFDPPAPVSGAADYDEYLNDPAQPVPYTSEIRHWYNRAFMLEDQRFAARRPDVLVYQTDTLSRELTVAGPIEVRFTVSTSGTDADWVVKLIDVFPDREGLAGPGGSSAANARLGGYQMLVRGDVLRGKFRNSLEEPQPFQPNVPTSIEFTLMDVFHTFKPGHRMMVQVQSSWFPMIDRNPGVFTDIYQAKAEEFRATTQRVYRGPGRASHLELRVLP